MVPDGTALDKALEIAEVIGANGPLAVEAIKTSVRATDGHVRGGGPGRRPGDRLAHLRLRGRRRGHEGLRREAPARLPAPVSGPPAGDRPIPFPDDHPDTARLRLAEALRPLITMTVAGTLDDAALEAAADAVERLARRAGRRAGHRAAHAPAARRRPADASSTSRPARSPGILNPIAPPVRLEVVDGADGGPPEIRATAWFDYPYEGPPTCVHGGVIAATFDEILGAANMVAGQPGHDRHPDRPLPQADPAAHRPAARGPVPRAGRAARSAPGPACTTATC